MTSGPACSGDVAPQSQEQKQIPCQATATSCGPAIDQIPYRMAELAPALLELGQGTMFRARCVIGHGVDEQRLTVEHVEHLQRVLFPIRREMQIAARCERRCQQMDKWRLDQAPLVMTLLRPRIGKED